MSKVIVMENSAYKYSPNFLDILRKKAAAFSKNGDTIETILKEDFGVDNILEYEMPDLTDKDQSDFIFDNVRGNISLMKGNIITVKDSQEISKSVAKINFAKLLTFAKSLKYKPKI